jgi:hypothetical protein
MTTDNTRPFGTMSDDVADFLAKNPDETVRVPTDDARPLSAEGVYQFGPAGAALMEAISVHDDYFGLVVAALDEAANAERARHAALVDAARWAFENHHDRAWSEGARYHSRIWADCTDDLCVERRKLLADKP